MLLKAVRVGQAFDKGYALRRVEVYCRIGIGHLGILAQSPKRPDYSQWSDPRPPSACVVYSRCGSGEDPSAGTPRCAYEVGHSRVTDLKLTTRHSVRHVLNR